MLAEENDRKADAKTGQNNAQGDQSAELGGLSAADLRQVDFFGCAEGAKIADGSVGEGGEEEPAESREGDERRWSASAEGENSVDEDELDQAKEKADEILCEEDVAESGRADEVELDAGSVHAETVVGKDGDAEEGVGDSGREDEAAAGAARS